MTTISVEFSLPESLFLRLKKYIVSSPTADWENTGSQAIAEFLQIHEKEQSNV